MTTESPENPGDASYVTRECIESSPFTAVWMRAGVVAAGATLFVVILERARGKRTSEVAAPGTSGGRCLSGEKDLCLSSTTYLR
jgi:hypothetical protein